MKLKNYKFKPKHWPPPRDRRDRDIYLFGFDADNQPYIVRWEHKKGEEGWVATTLINDKSEHQTAAERTYGPDTVSKLLHYWSDAPCLMHTVRTAIDYDYEIDEDDDD